MTRSAISRSAFLFLASLILGGTVQAELPRVLSHQGRLSVNGTNFDGTGQFKFLLYKHTDSDAVDPSLVDLPLWSNASTTPVNLNEPAVAVNLPVTKGLYSLGLGNQSLPNMAALPANLVPAPPYDQVFLRIWFSHGGGFEQLMPDHPVSSAPFALHATRAEGVVDGSIGSAALAPGAVTAAKIQPGAISQLGTPDGSIPDAFKMDDLGHGGLGTTNPQAALHVAGGADVTAPVLLSLLEGSDTISGVANNGRGLLAVANSREGLVTFYDITNPAAPQWRLQIRNGTATNGHLYDSLLNVSHLSFDPTGTLLAIAASDALTSSSKKITLVTVSDAAAPNPTFQSVLEDDAGDFQDLEQIQALSFSDTEPRLLTAASISHSGNDTVSLIDVTEPSAPGLIAVMRDEEDGFERLRGPRGLAFRGSLLAIAASSDSAVTLVDLSNPENPELQAVLEQHEESGGHTYTGLAAPLDVDLRGDLLAIAAIRSGVVGDEAGLTLVDVSTPSDPQHLATLLGGPEGLDLVSQLWSVALGENELLAVGSHGGLSDYGNPVTLFDVSNPAAPVIREVMRDGQGELGSIQWPDVQFAGSLLIISSTLEKKLTIVDPAATLAGAAGMVVEERFGIGVENPGAALHVRGDVRIDNASLFAVESRRIAMGIGNAVTDGEGVAIGRSNTAGYFSTALGYNTTAEGGYATALGSSAVASGWSSAALGTSVEASGEQSMALGASSQASGKRSLAAGSNTWAEGENAVAIGDNARAEQNGSVALGNYVTASGFNALALGFATEASGNNATAMGVGGVASGITATVMGVGTVAPSYAETALGSYNTNPGSVFDAFQWDSRDRLLVIGNGTSDTLRTDLLTIFKDGRLQHAGSIATVGEVSTLSNFRYGFPRARRYQVPASAFTAGSSDMEYILGDGYLQYPLGGGTNLGTFKAPVHLPDGATVTKLTVYYYDDFENPGGGGSSVYITNIQGDLRRLGLEADSVSSELVVATRSAGTMNFPEEPIKYSVAGTNVLQPDIDNIAFQYHLKVDFSVNTPSSSLRFYGATIEYTQEVVAP